MKKVLSFVLVLAMILGSVSMVFATAFTDDADITNKEASAVLSKIGVIEGYTDGTFKPNQTLTRAEGAAILARLVLGKAEAAKLTTVVSPFNDVPATHWAAGFISYCVAQGYINGYGNGNFGPEDTLTVAAFGKMMLTAVGYKSQNEGFTGDAWETNVGSVMVKAGLTDGVTITGSNACSRGTAAQVALNTLKADLVEYDGTPVTVSTGSVTVSTGQSAAKKIAQGAVAVTYKNEAVYQQFMEVYQKDLVLGADNTDEFGRPNSNQWTYKNENVYKAKSTKNLIASYTNKVTQGTLYTLLDNHDAKNAQINVYRNGAATVTTYAGIAAAGINKNNTDAYNSANGSQVEVYYSSSAPATVYIVVTDPFLVQADSDYNATKKSVKVSPVGGLAGINLPADEKELKSKDFAVTGVKEDDYLILTVADNVVKSVAPATKVTGVIGTYTQDTDITIDGTKYTKGAAFGKDGAPAAAFNDLSVGSTVTLIVDANNFVLATTDETTSSQYVFIYKIANETNLADSVVASAYFTDGTKQTITLNNIDNAAATVGATAAAWYNYNVRSDGKYNLTSLTSANHVALANVQVDAGKVAYATDGATAFAPASGETVFITKVGNTIKTYTGYKNVPGTAGMTATVAAVEKSGYAKYVFVENATGLVGANTTDYVFIFKDKVGGDYKTVKTANNDTYYTNGNAFVNGEKKTAEFGVTALAGDTIGSAVELYYNLAYDGDGRIEQGTKLAGTNVVTNGFGYIADATTTKGAIEYKSGVITIKGASVELDDNAMAYVIDDSKAVDSAAASKVKSLLDDAAAGYDTFLVYTNTKDGIVKTLFFVEQ